MNGLPRNCEWKLEHVLSLETIAVKEQNTVTPSNIGKTSYIHEISG